MSIGGDFEFFVPAGKGASIFLPVSEYEPLALAAFGPERLAHVMPILRREVPWVKRMPSEYIREHVRISTQPMELADDPKQLYQMFEIEPRFTDPSEGILVILETEGRKACLFVDELVGQQQVVVKSLEANFRKVPGLSGATVMGDGSVALILDVGHLLRLSGREEAMLL